MNLTNLRTDRRVHRRGNVPIEYLILGTFLALGLIVAADTLKNQINAESLETGNSILSFSQAYQTSTIECCNASKAGSAASDTFEGIQPSSPPGPPNPPDPPEPPLPPDVGGGDEGLSHGFWKNHPDAWVGYAPTDNYNAVFGVADDPGLTLQAALERGGGQENALGREAVAAILNAASPGISYPYTLSSIISAVQQAYATGQYEGLKNQLDAANNLGAN